MVACERCGHDPSARVVASWSFFVDKEVESLNAHRVNAGAKWQQAAYRRERNNWSSWMMLCKSNERVPTATAKRRVRLVRQYTGRQRAFDRDNLIGGMKPCVDAMVRAGILAGDAEQWAEIDYAQRKGGPNERSGLWVIVEELEATCSTS